MLAGRSLIRARRRALRSTRCPAPPSSPRRPSLLRVRLQVLMYDHTTKDCLRARHHCHRSRWSGRASDWIFSIPFGNSKGCLHISASCRGLRCSRQWFARSGWPVAIRPPYVQLRLVQRFAGDVDCGIRLAARDPRRASGSSTNPDPDSRSGMRSADIAKRSSLHVAG